MVLKILFLQEISRKDKPLISKRNGYSRPASSRNIMNPKKELADSLPLCHPNDDYLKDFNLISSGKKIVFHLHILWPGLWILVFGIKHIGIH